MLKKLGLFIAIIAISSLSIGIVFADQNKDWSKVGSQSSTQGSNTLNENKDKEKDWYKSQENNSASNLQKKLDEYRAKKAEEQKAEAEKKQAEEQKKAEAEKKQAEEQKAEAEKKQVEEQKAEAEKKQVEASAKKAETTITTNEKDDQKVDIITKTESAVTKVEYYTELSKKAPAIASRKEKSEEAKVSEEVKVSDVKSASVTIPNYLGTAEKDETGDFKLTVDANNTLPNGAYNLKAKLYKEDGTTEEGSKKTILVETKIETLVPEERKKFEKSEADTDNDGIPDKEEIRLGTNPLLADSDGDGFLDSDEVKNGFNPLKFSPGDKSDKIAFESPKSVFTENNVSVTPVVDTNFAVNAVALATVEATPTNISVDQKSEEKKDQNTTEKKISTKKVARFSGKALPNIFVTLYIFSDPIVVTVKTDADGNWSYDLDKEIPDGNHEVYVAVTDNVGKITSQSRALPFVKTADAIDIVPTAVAASAEEIQKNATPIEKSKTQFILITFVIITTFVGIAFVLIGRKSSFIK